MKQHRLLLLIIWPLVSPFLSQAQDHSLLWEITGDDLPGPSYLYGTMHVQDERAFQFKESVMPAFDRSEAFAMELLIDDVDPMSMMMMMAMDSTLKELYSEEDYTRLETWFKDSLRMDLYNFNRIKPFFIYAQVAQTQFGTEQQQAVDLHFHQLAKTAGKDMHGLETLEEQMHAINTMSLSEQAKMLLASIDEVEEAGEDPNQKLMEYYLAGDLEGLMTWAESMDMGKEFESEFLQKRNQKMKERLLPLIQDKPTFSAVGALHLPGEGGLIDLLRKEGFTVKPA